MRRPLLERAGLDVAAHLEATAERLADAGATVEAVDLPASVEGLFESGLRVMQVAAATIHRQRFAHHADRFRPKIRALIEAGMELSGVDYAAAEVHCRQLKVDVGPLLAGVDALLMPVADTPAPKGLSSTGDPSFCAPWTFTGTPAVALPSGLASDGLPLAVQLAATDEVRLLTTAAWCEAVLGVAGIPPVDSSGR